MTSCNNQIPELYPIQSILFAQRIAGQQQIAKKIASDMVNSATLVGKLSESEAVKLQVLGNIKANEFAAETLRDGLIVNRYLLVKCLVMSLSEKRKRNYYEKLDELNIKRVKGSTLTDKQLIMAIDLVKDEIRLIKIQSIINLTELKKTKELLRKLEQHLNKKC